MLTHSPPSDTTSSDMIAPVIAPMPIPLQKKSSAPSSHSDTSSQSPTSYHKHHRYTSSNKSASESSNPETIPAMGNGSTAPITKNVPLLRPPPPSLSDLIMDEQAAEGRNSTMDLPIPGQQYYYPDHSFHSRSHSQSHSQSSPQSSLRSPSPISIKRASWYAGSRDGYLTVNDSSLPTTIVSPPSPTIEAKFPMAPPPRSISPMKLLSAPKQPFNFVSTIASTSTPNSGLSPAKANQRRGHRYKHSSVSMNFFQEPPTRAPLAIPASLPIPNFTEWRQSMSKEQRIRLSWTACHIFAAILVYNCDAPFTALAALSHLLLYDAMGAILCVAVDVLGNFDAWKQSSIHLPFGLERIEVLAGFALSVSLIFMGGDIISHVVQEVVQSVYAPGQHGHSHGRAIHSHAGGLSLEDSHEEALNWASVVFRVMLGILATIVSAIGLNNHSRISRTMNRDRDLDSSTVSWMPSVLSNPTHLMTITFSVAILLFPLLGSSGYVIVDALLTPVIAASMCYVGWLHAKALAGMLVMSYSGHDRIEDIDEQIRQDPLVQSVCDISLWQVHHELWLASMKIVMSGTDEDERRLRERASAIVKTTMGEDELSRWETTIDISRTTLE